MNLSPGAPCPWCWGGCIVRSTILFQLPRLRVPQVPGGGTWVSCEARSSSNSDVRGCPTSLGWDVGIVRSTILFQLRRPRVSHIPGVGTGVSCEARSSYKSTSGRGWPASGFPLNVEDGKASFWIPACLRPPRSALALRGLPILLEHGIQAGNKELVARIARPKTALQAPGNRWPFLASDERPGHQSGRPKSWRNRVPMGWPEIRFDPGRSLVQTESFPLPASLRESVMTDQRRKATSANGVYGDGSEAGDRPSFTR
jgi:hypothetical protein